MKRGRGRGRGRRGRGSLAPLRRRSLDMRGLIGDGGELEGGSKRGMGRDREGGDDKSRE